MFGETSKHFVIDNLDGNDQQGYASLLAPALFHSAMNAFGNVISIMVAGKILFIGLALFAFVLDRMWEKLPSDHRAVY